MNTKTKFLSSESLIDGGLSRLASWVGLLLVVGIFLIRTSAHFSYTPDDTYIYLQYARNLVQHQEVAFNSGDPSYGVTSPLWLALISSSSWCGFDSLTASKVLDAVAAAMSIVALFFLQQHFLQNRFVALAAAAAFSTHIWFLRWAGSGMETSLATLLSILVLLTLSRKQLHRAALLSGVLVLARPEAAVLVGVGSVCVLAGSKERLSGRDLVWPITLFFLVLLPWYVYSYRTFGSILPNTALAKSGLAFSLDDAVSTLVDIVQTLGASDGISLAALLFFVVLSVLKMKSGIGLNRSEFVDLLLLFAWVASLVVLYVATGTNVISRYLMLIAPGIVLLAFSVPFHILSSTMFRQAKLKFTFLLALVIVVYNVGLFESRVRPQINAFASGMQSCLIYIGSWLRNNTPRDARVLTGDVGAVGYYSERKICDAAGLVSTELLPLARLGYNVELLRHEQEYRARCQAQYVIESSRVVDPPRPDGLKPLVTRTMYGLRMTSNDPVYYTVLRVEEQQK